MKFLELIKAVPGEGGVKQVGGGNPEILGICEDSRLVKAGDLFVARSGTKTKGSEFAKEAIAKGAVAIVSDEKLALPENLAFAQLERANQAMGFMAQRLMGDPAKGITALAVTGTKGKTTIAYLIRSILKAAGKKCGLVGTVELDDGKKIVPAEMTTPGPIELAELMGRMRDNGVTHCVMEVSSHALHQERVAGIEFAVGMFSNLTGDHLDYHKTMEAYGEAKALLFERLGTRATAVVNADDAWGERMAKGMKGKVVRYGVRGGKEERGEGKEKLDWVGEIEAMTSRGTTVRVTAPEGKNWKLKSPLVGRHNVYNSLCAMGAAEAVGISRQAIVEGLEAMTGVPGRLQAVRVEEELGFQVFVDYAHTHDALENVLTAVRATMGQGDTQNLKLKTQNQGKLICVFGCGGDRDRTKRPKMGAIAQRLADEVIVTSDNPRTEEPGGIIQEILAGLVPNGRANVEVRADRREAIRLAVEMADNGDVVVIAGKGHENYQIVGKTKLHFDDVEEAAEAMRSRASGIEMGAAQ